MSRVKEIEKTIKDLEGKLFSVEQEIVGLEQDVKGLESKKSRLLTEEAMGQLKSKKDLQDTKANLGDLQELLEDKELARDGLKQTILQEEENVLQEKLRELNVESEEVEKLYQGVGRSIEERRKEISAFQEQGTELHARWDSLQEDILKLGGKMRNPEKVFGLNKIFSNVQ